MTAYTITATNSAGSTTATLNLVKCAATVLPPSGLSYAKICGEINTALTGPGVLTSDGGEAVTYSIAPATAGVSINATTGEITVNSAAKLADISLTVTATNSAGSTTAAVVVRTFDSNDYVTLTGANAFNLAQVPFKCGFTQTGSRTGTDTATVNGLTGPLIGVREDNEGISVVSGTLMSEVTFQFTALNNSTVKEHINIWFDNDTTPYVLSPSEIVTPLPGAGNQAVNITTAGKSIEAVSGAGFGSGTVTIKKSFNFCSVQVTRTLGLPNGAVIVMKVR